MRRGGKMAIREFAALTGLSKDTLRYYDKIGLLSPELRGENGYRYYTDRQLDLAIMIANLRALGIGIEEIRVYAQARSPARMLALFDEQDARIEAELARLQEIREVIHLRAAMAREALMRKDQPIFLEQRPREPIFLCSTVEEGEDDIEALARAYQEATLHGVELSLPYGARIEEESLGQDGGRVRYRYYFKDARRSNAEKPAGLYLIYYHRLEDWSEYAPPTAILQYMQEHRLELCGNVYEEYPLDELVNTSWEDFTQRLEVSVVKR